LVPWAVHRWSLRRLDPSVTHQRQVDPPLFGAAGYRVPTLMRSVTQREPSKRHLASYVERLVLAVMWITPLLMPNDHWQCLGHASFGCCREATRSTAEIMTMMACVFGVFLFHAPPRRTLL
jgi:hypothetical protein